ncbi:MAG: 2-C-methyl-D-erythritol 2,4-cyclodiphosphate synthase [Bacillota bacterium]|nr:2-C-methyl-D-erythritol 2,4-cyclodiphosphate synthase [Bacillota bacterium]MDW7677138.1 2-C-methyl-D-erythritol 2,4-cyclodiphosphate synthase [Bacillota bacterium]
MRIGTGFDVHALVEGRRLILGGVAIPHPAGLMGHSDADVLTHAVMDALLGAAGLEDIGRHFPDSDETYRGVSSLTLLKKVVLMVNERGLTIECVDAVIIAQQPRMALHLSLMKEKMAASMNIGVDRMNVKATTTEHLGFIGREEGIAAQAVALLKEKQDQ